MTTRYNKQHYEDVARILSARWSAARLGNQYEHKELLRWLADDFADLFAADNPHRCIDCGSQCGEADPEGKCVNHLPAGGFDRERFLKACGLGGE